MAGTGRPAVSGNTPGTPRLLRVINERGLMEYLRQHAPLSRAQLARETRLSKPTVSLALASLEQAGLVRAIGQAAPEGGGRQAVLYEPDPTIGYVVGVDIGRSWVRVAVSDLAGTIIARRDERNLARSARTLVEMTSTLAHTAITAAGCSWPQVIHTVVGTPGVFDQSSGRVLFASNLPGWGKSGLVAMLREALGASLTVDNDANLAAIAEQSFGHGAKAATFVFILVGTGIGMGIVIDGTLYRGAHGGGGEIGYLPFGAVESPEFPMTTSTRRHGMLERTAGAEGIVQSAHMLGMQPPLSPKLIFDAARSGNLTALKVVELEGQHLAVAVAAVAATLDPELIILGGGIGRNIDLLRKPIEESLHHITPLRPHLLASELGDDTVLLGAIATGLGTARDIIFEQRVGAERAAAVISGHL